MTMAAIVDPDAGVTGGVDTHLDTHVAAALDSLGALLGVESFESGRAGEDKLISWLCSFGPVVRVGVEGTGSYGAGLSRRLRAAGIAVVEVDRPNRQERRRAGKSDPVDAVEAARAAQSGRAHGQAKTRDGNVEAIRVLLVAKRSCRAGAAVALTQIRHLAHTAPDELAERFRRLPRGALIDTAVSLRPRNSADPVTFATKVALGTLGRRIAVLDTEKARLNVLLDELVDQTAPDLVALGGVGVDSAATLLVTAGDNPERLCSEASWAHLCGVAPIPASSGKTVRYRLNRGGDRHANRALWHIAMSRMRTDERTQAYVTRRSDEGKTKLEIIRMLKRYIAREVYHHLPQRH